MWVVHSLSGLLAIAPSLDAALRRAHELSARTASLLEAPSRLVRVGTDEVMDAFAIHAAWRAMGLLTA